MKLSNMRLLAKKLDEFTRDSFVDIQSHFRTVPPRQSEITIIFLGTGQGAHNIASRGAARLPISRLVSGPIIATHESAIWIDPGPDCLEAISRTDFDPRCIDAIFVSHSHVDHVGNLLAAIELITGATEIKKTKSLYGNETAILGGPDSPSIIDQYHSQIILKEASALKIADIVRFPGIQVQAIPCHHRETKMSDKSLNWRLTLQVNKESIVVSYIDGNVFIPDSIGEPSNEVYKDLIKASLNSDIIIANVANHVRMRTSKQNYPSTRGLLTLLQHVRPKVAFTTHFGIEMMNPNKVEKKLLNKYGFANTMNFQAAYIQAELKKEGILCQVIPSSDGMKVFIEERRLVLTPDEFGIGKINL